MSSIQLKKITFKFLTFKKLLSAMANFLPVKYNGKRVSHL